MKLKQYETGEILTVLQYKIINLPGSSRKNPDFTVTHYLVRHGGKKPFWLPAEAGEIITETGAIPRLK